MLLLIASSSNGRTHPSGGCYLGSSPSPAANKKHAYDSGLTKIGSKRSSSKLTEELVMQMPDLIKSGKTIKQISYWFNFLRLC